MCIYQIRKQKKQIFNPIDPYCIDCSKLRQPVVYYGRRCHDCFKTYRNRFFREKRRKNKMNTKPTEKEKKLIKQKLFKEFKDYTGTLSIMIHC